MIYDISEENMKNLQIFLWRVDLKGSEVQAFINVNQALSTPIKEEQRMWDDNTSPKTKLNINQK